MSASLYEMLSTIRNASMSAFDRELLRPAFAAMDQGHEIHLPEMVIKRVRNIYARVPKGG